MARGRGAALSAADPHTRRYPPRSRASPHVVPGAAVVGWRLFPGLDVSLPGWLEAVPGTDAASFHPCCRQSRIGPSASGVPRETPWGRGWSAPSQGRSGNTICCDGRSLASPGKHDFPAVTEWLRGLVPSACWCLWALLGCDPNLTAGLGLPPRPLGSPPRSALGPWRPGQDSPERGACPELSQPRSPCCSPALSRPDSCKPGMHRRW